MASEQGHEADVRGNGFVEGVPLPLHQDQLLGFARANRDHHPAAGRELFLHFPMGISNSKISTAAVEAALKTPGTCRNWNTVQKLLAIAEDLDSCDRGGPPRSSGVR